ncbi:MAG TPA: amidohydrolase family protein [Pseudonocardiaceae bacterium]|nr:amidohydrolase family protein [Pseudonocardiaceae bacterium]
MPDPEHTVISGATVVTMDDSIGVLDNADVVIEGDRIHAVEPRTGPGPESGRIVVPGFVNAHLHTWQTALRGIAGNWTLLEYLRWTHAGLATHFTPDDIHHGTLAGALNQLNCGTTTLADWCHNNPTPQHTDAAVDALDRSGIRATFLHGSPKPDPKPGEPPYWEVPHPRAEIERLAGQSRFDGGLLRLGLAVLGPQYATVDVVVADGELADEIGLVTSMHQGGGLPRAPEGWQALLDRNLLGPHVNVVHGHDLTDDQLRRFTDLGVTFSVTPEIEMTMGHGHPLIGRLRDHGVAPSIGVDLESCLSGDLLTAARTALAHQRALDNAVYRQQAKPGEPPIADIPSLTTMDALRWITVEGARMLGQTDRIGSITPGKQADLVVIDARQPNMQPVHDPVNAVVLQAGLANVDSVMVAGRWRKRHGVLLDQQGKQLDPETWLVPLRESADRLTAAIGL